MEDCMPRHLSRSPIGVCLAAALALVAAAAPARAASPFWDTVFTSLGYAEVDAERTLAAQPRLIESALAPQVAATLRAVA